MTPSSFVANGRENLARSAEVQSCRASRSAQVRAKYAPALARAGRLKRMMIHGIVRREIHREERKAEPSPLSLF